MHDENAIQDELLQKLMAFAEKGKAEELKNKFAPDPVAPGGDPADPAAALGALGGAGPGEPDGDEMQGGDPSLASLDGRLPSEGGGANPDDQAVQAEELERLLAAIGG